MIGGADTPGAAAAVAVANDLVYIADDTAGFQILPTQCDASAVPYADVPGPAMALRMYPNPGARRATADFETLREGRVLAGVYDFGGRRIRSLLDSIVGAGTHRLQWDGCDQNGRVMPAGIYLIRVSAPDREMAARFVKLR
jgi:hypothetical protein